MHLLKCRSMDSAHAYSVSSDASLLHLPLTLVAIRQQHTTCRDAFRASVVHLTELATPSVIAQTLELVVRLSYHLKNTCEIFLNGRSRSIFTGSAGSFSPGRGEHAASTQLPLIYSYTHAMQSIIVTCFV